MLIPLIKVKKARSGNEDAQNGYSELVPAGFPSIYHLEDTTEPHLLKPDTTVRGKEHWSLPFVQAAHIPPTQRRFSVSQGDSF